MFLTSPIPTLLRLHGRGDCAACASTPLSSGLLCGEGSDETFPMVSHRPPSDLFLGDLRPAASPEEVSRLAHDLWDASAGLPRRVRSEALRSLLVSRPGRTLLTAFFREHGRFAVAEFLDVDRLRLSEREKFRRGREVAGLLFEHLPFLEGSALGYCSVSDWSGSGVWLFRSFAGFLPRPADLPVSMFLDPPQAGLGPCVAGSIFLVFDALAPEQQEVFGALLPEWQGSLASLVESCRLL